RPPSAGSCVPLRGRTRRTRCCPRRCATPIRSVCNGSSTASGRGGGFRLWALGFGRDRRRREVLNLQQLPSNSIPPKAQSPKPNAYSDAVIARVVRRLIPFAFICYVVAYVDRVNIGFAAVYLQRDLGLSDTAYGIGAGLFFLGYFVFEIPSNLILERVGARVWIARIMIVWGIVSMATMFVGGKWSFYIARVVLGLAEAGFFPGMVLFFTYWIPAADRARTGALFMMAAPIAIVVGAPVSEALLKLQGRFGLAGWQWLFLME